MTAAINTYTPDYAVPPGWILEEHLETHGMSHAEFARRCGRSAKLISDIISGKAPVEPGTALEFEKVLGMDASIWLGIEADYQLHKAREEETKRFEHAVVWSQSFPVNELIKRHCFEKPKNALDAVRKLLSFFGVASVDTWSQRYSAANVAYRHSPTFGSSDEAIATWLRLGELAADQQDCAEYNASAFKLALKEIRELTTKAPSEFLPMMTHLCNEAGVTVVIIKGLPKTALSGAARWLSPRKALIQLSLRYKSDDQLWFSFFHEAAHLLLHSKKDIFIESNGGNRSEMEKDADAWAANFLVPRLRWEEFKVTKPIYKAAVIAFAKKQGIAPGIVVGMLQHEHLLPWAHLNGLKKRYQWVDTDS